MSFLDIRGRVYLVVKRSLLDGSRFESRIRYLQFIHLRNACGQFERQEAEKNDNQTPRNRGSGKKNWIPPTCYELLTEYVRYVSNFFLVHITLGRV